VLVRNEQERVSEGVWRGIYTPHTENKPLLKGYPETPGNDPDTSDPEHSGLEPGLSGFNSMSHSRMLLCGILSGHGLYFVLFVFLEH